jgi:hypothetical protein
VSPPSRRDLFRLRLGLPLRPGTVVEQLAKPGDAVGGTSAEALVAESPPPWMKAKEVDDD